MRMRICGLALLAALCLASSPSQSYAQIGAGLAPGEFLLPIPVGGERFRQDGTGFFLAFEMLFMEQTNPMEAQTVARRGFVDIDGSIGPNIGLPATPGAFIGSGTEALNTREVGGPDSYQPGLAMAGGWRFGNGAIIEFGWWHLSDTRYSATASVIPPGFALDANLAETFLTSPNFNFATEFAGAGQNVQVGNVGATFGIWNAASEMTIDFVQRMDMGYMAYRVPIDRGDNHRIYGSFGAKAIILWERFKWRTVGRDTNGQAQPIHVANFTNVVSNRLYGATFGFTYDWYLGASPVGGFALTASLEGSLMVDIVKERAKYELGDLSTAASRAINEYTIAPMLQADLALWWFPYEAVQFRVGYNLLAVFNTVAAERPIDFNVGAVSPNWEKGNARFFKGLHIGGGFLF